MNETFEEKLLRVLQSIADSLKEISSRMPPKNLPQELDDQARLNKPRR